MRMYNADVNTSTHEDLLTPVQAARRKGVTHTTVYKAMQRGALAYVKLLGHYALRPADVDAWTPDTHGGRRAGQGRRPKTEGAAP